VDERKSSDDDNDDDDDDLLTRPILCKLALCCIERSAGSRLTQRPGPGARLAGPSNLLAAHDSRLSDAGRAWAAD
jgi:hypothetical protein